MRSRRFRAKRSRRQVPRARFRGCAAADRLWAEHAGPKIQGRILQALGINPRDRSLEIGTERLFECGHEPSRGATHSIDIHAELTAQAAANLKAVPQARVTLETRDAFDRAPLGEFDVIAVTGSMLCTIRASSARCAPAPAVRRGRLAPVMDAVLVRRIDETEWMRESLFETVIDPLINAAAAPAFVF